MQESFPLGTIFTELPVWIDVNLYCPLKAGLEYDNVYMVSKGRFAEPNNGIPSAIATPRCVL